MVGLRACPPWSTSTIERTLAGSAGQRSSIQGAGSFNGLGTSGSCRDARLTVPRKVTTPPPEEPANRHRQPLSRPCDEENLEILGTPGAAQAIREGLADAAAHRFADNDEIKARYGVV